VARLCGLNDVTITLSRACIKLANREMGTVKALVGLLLQLSLLKCMTKLPSPTLSEAVQCS
jgi:hypothetical protein